MKARRKDRKKTEGRNDQDLTLISSFFHDANHKHRPFLSPSHPKQPELYCFPINAVFFSRASSLSTRHTAAGVSLPTASFTCSVLPTNHQLSIPSDSLRPITTTQDEILHLTHRSISPRGSIRPCPGLLVRLPSLESSIRASFWSCLYFIPS